MEGLAMTCRQRKTCEIDGAARDTGSRPLPASNTRLNADLSRWESEGGNRPPG
jgi:hypothetical protein